MIGMAACSEQLLPPFALGSQHQEPKFEYSDFIDIEISEAKIPIGETTTSATAINGTVPGPLVRLKEGTDAVLRVSNRLAEDSSIHWHGLILPFRMDGVPGLSFDGIRPGETFEYRFPVTQNGTYWYHSHSGLQEQTGVYGPIVVDPIDREPWSYDREYVVMLSDWTLEDPHRLMAKIKKQADYSNFQQRTLKEFYANVRDRGFLSTARERLMWSKMRMMASDIADVTGYRYTYLMNGQAPSSNWQALFHPGERVRLRVINAAAMTYFDIRIPGLSMKVVQADGQNVKPVVVDEFRISVAETYDVIVEPKSDQAYTIFAETMDRSGFARGTLTPRSGMSAAIPRRRKRPTLTMMDMGMEMKGMHGMQMKANAVAEGGPDSVSESVAESLYRTPNRFNTSRLSQPCDCPR